MVLTQFIFRLGLQWKNYDKYKKKVNFVVLHCLNLNYSGSYLFYDIFYRQLSFYPDLESVIFVVITYKLLGVRVYVISN